MSVPKTVAATVVWLLLAAGVVGCTGGDDPEPPSEAEVRAYLLGTGQVEEGTSPFTDEQTLLVTSTEDCEVSEIIIDPQRVEAEVEFGGIVNGDETFALASSGGPDSLTACDQAVRDLAAGF